MQQDLLGELSLPAANSTAESASATPTATSTVSTRQEDLGQTDPASGHKSQPAESQDPGIAPEASQETEATQEPLGEPSPLATHTTDSAPATPLATGSNSKEPEGPSPTDPAAGQKPPLAETQDPTPAPKTSASNATRSQRRRSTELDREVRAVKLSEIDGIDDEIREFLAQNDILTEVSIQADRYSQALQDWTVRNLHLTLWLNKGRLVHLGTGRALTLARRLVLHDQTLPATIITSKTLSREDKLMALAHEELIMSAFHRPRPGHVASMVRLHEALIQAGVDVLKEPGFRAFASATGISPAALKPYWHTETSK